MALLVVILAGIYQHTHHPGELSQGRSISHKHYYIILAVFSASWLWRVKEPSMNNIFYSRYFLLFYLFYYSERIIIFWIWIQTLTPYWLYLLYALAPAQLLLLFTIIYLYHGWTISWWKESNKWNIIFEENFYISLMNYQRGEWIAWTLLIVLKSFHVLSHY